MCASVAAASVYTFDGLPGANGSALNGQADTLVTWNTSEAGNHNLITLGVYGPDKRAQVLNPSSQRVCSTPIGGGSLFGLTSSDTELEISYIAYMDKASPWLNGIWVDLDGNGTMPNSEAEIALQFGARTGATYGWRLRGAAVGTPNYYYGSWPGIGATPATMLITVNVSLVGNGAATMYVYNLTDPVTYPVVKVFDHVALGLNSADARMRDPANWTGWTLRNQNAGSTIYSTIDNLTVIPEPATLSLLVLGGLACLRRRR